MCEAKFGLDINDANDQIYQGSWIVGDKHLPHILVVPRFEKGKEGYTTILYATGAQPSWGSRFEKPACGEKLGIIERNEIIVPFLEAPPRGTVRYHLSDDRSRANMYYEGTNGKSQGVVKLIQHQ